jgi:glycosyltransferase involved in cell wall biosynthesis
VGLFVEKMALRRADRILVINEKLKELVVRLGAPESRTTVLRAGIDNKRFNPALSPDAVRQRYGLSGEDTVLFFMGWLYKFSGLKEVALQLAEIPDPRVKMLVVGEGDLYAELVKMQQERGLKHRLVLAGRKDYAEIPAHIAVADICLLPAYPGEKIMRDIVPIKLYEYMAMRKPVISTRLPGVLKEFGETNGIVYVDRPEDVIPKALELLKSNSLNTLGLRAEKFAAKNSWQKIADEFESILTQAIEEKKEKN